VLAQQAGLDAERVYAVGGKDIGGRADVAARAGVIRAIILAIDHLVFTRRPS